MSYSQSMPNPHYFPIEKGVYELTPGLRPFGFDFGNGDFDQKLFQIDSEFETFRKNKICCLAERKDKYVQRFSLSLKVESEISEFIRSRLKEEHKIEVTDSSLDDLALLVPEDFAVISRDQNSDWVSYLHLCSPSHWSAEGKIGKSFFAVHAPVPGIEKILKAQKAMVDAIISKGPFVRFVWSFVTDRELNHHPDSVHPRVWRGESENPFFLRVERQVTWPFPSLNAGLFTIRVSFVDSQVIKSNAFYKENLVSALKGMTDESLQYKGILDFRDQVIEYLDSP